MSNRSSLTTSRIVRREACSSGECFVVESDTGSTTTFTADLALQEQRNPNGTWIRVTPGLRSLKWPVSVGDHWSDSVTIEESTGRKQAAQLKGEVVSYESVTVPAGSFMAYKVIVTLGGRRFREVWYAPETKTVVKSITYDAQGRETVSELVNYQKSDEPAAAFNVPLNPTGEEQARGDIGVQPPQPPTLQLPEGISCPKGAVWTGNGCIAPRR